jgi:DNA polymerase-4
MDNSRKIIHIDMDAFYASIEQRDNPRLKGKPVVVGGDPCSRGVVCTCSYEARKFGIHSAMASSKAKKLCPQAIFLQPRMEHYQQQSMQIREIFMEYTDMIEPLSLDEAYLDVTVNKKGMPSATLIARDILYQIKLRTGLTASAGVSFNKFLAKVASDVNKPYGMKVVPPWEASAFIDTLPIEKFHGVGKVTAHKLKNLGVNTGADLKKLTIHELIRHFGKNGSYYYEIAHAMDNRPVDPSRIRKSVGRETTLAEDVNDRTLMLQILAELAEEVEETLLRIQEQGRTIVLKIKYDDFQSVTRSRTLHHETNSAKEIMHHAETLLEKTEAGQRNVRLLGVSVTNFPNKRSGAIQLEFDF